MNDNLITEVPDDICFVQNMEVFSLARNRILFLNPIVCKIHSIQMLDLRGNHMTNLPQEVSSSTNLSTLHVM